MRNRTSGRCAACIVIVLAILSTRQVNSWWWAPIVIGSLAFTFTGLVYLFARNFYIFVPYVNPVIAVLGWFVRPIKSVLKIKGKIVAKPSSLAFLTSPLNFCRILGAHMFDASSTFTAIDIVGGFAEKHVVPVCSSIAPTRLSS